ncbi:Molybdenum-pterin-binding protein 2 [Candidatus Magnetomoraceae bacterium gMMP-15]
MKCSARNVFRGKVLSVKKGPVNSEVTIELAGGLEIVATVTTRSAENLGLTKGADATALIKATHVMLMSE